MTPGNAVWLGVGFLAGMATWFTQIDAPKSADCSIPRVSRKVATSYVLKPPPAEVIYKACPQAEKVEPAKVEEPVVEEKPRRHRRHHRRWRRWR